MGLVFDNFDELSEMLSGYESLHDTMGILHHNKTPLGGNNTTDTQIMTLPEKKTKQNKKENIAG